MTVIDTHQHNWDFRKFDYRWITPGTILAHNYLPEDALPVMQAAGVDQCVLVEAGVKLPAELPWFLELAATHDHIAGVVGHIDLVQEDTAAVLAGLNPDHRTLLKGVRIGVRTPDTDIEAQHAGLRILAAHNLTCDLLIQNQSLGPAQALVAAHPDITFILDHFAGGKITAGGHTDWRAQTAPLAALPNTVMKVSGYLTAADPMPPTAQTLKPYFEAALDLFGPSRLMYGSDWPVCLRGGSYALGVELLKNLTGALSPDEQAAIQGRTAIETYHL